MAASSVLIFIWCIIAALDLTVKGSRRITYEITMIAAVALSNKGGALNRNNRAIPTIEPGTRYGNMVITSKILVTTLRLRTVI